METVVSCLMFAGLLAAALGLFRPARSVVPRCGSCAGELPPGFTRLDDFGRPVCRRCVVVLVEADPWRRHRRRGR